ncbi:MAG TPA: hypothetical protein VMZ03_08535 [Chitinophagaceae bacterium]|nr:hypothetical protein [Chitinophagaceae bacterium]
MKIKFIFILLVWSGISNHVKAQVNYDTLLTGSWKGSSICQVKNSPCHDETVVFYISKKAGIDTFYINGNKIVNGVEEEMGILPFTLNGKTNQLISTSYGLWTFIIKQRKIEGTLVSKGALYRIINLTKQN